MLDLSTKAGALAYAERTRRGMVQCFERLGRFEANGFSYGATLFITHEPPSAKAMRRVALEVGQGEVLKLAPGPKLSRVEPMAVNLPTWMHGLPGSETINAHTHARDIFSQAVKAFAKMTRAVGVVFTAEAWTVMTNAAPGQTPQQVRDQLPADLGQADNRGECLFVSIEHAALERRYIWRSVIGAKRKIGPWVEQDWHDAQGRMVGLVDWRS